MTRRIDSAPPPAHQPAAKPTGGKASTPKPTPTTEAAKKESADRLERSYSLSDTHSKDRQLLAGDATFSRKDAVSPGLAVPDAARELVDLLPAARRDGKFEKKVHVAGGEASYSNDLVKADASWDVVSAYAGGRGDASLGARGLRANGELYAGGSLADAEAKALVAYGPVQAEVGGRAYAGAKANVTGHLTVDPLKGVYYAEVGGQAFAGAKAGVSGTAHLGPLGNVGGTAEAWAGAGVQLKGRAGLKDGHFKFKIDMGAALGIGFKLGAEIDLNLKPLGALGRTLANLLGGAPPSTVSAAAASEGVVNFFNSLHAAKPAADLHSGAHDFISTAPP